MVGLEVFPLLEITSEQRPEGGTGGSLEVWGRMFQARGNGLTTSLLHLFRMVNTSPSHLAPSMNAPHNAESTHK